MVDGVAGWPCVRESIAASRCSTARAERVSMTPRYFGSQTWRTASRTVMA